MKQSLLKGLTEDQIAKVGECKDRADLLQLAKDEGVELTEEQLLAVTGGACSTSDDGNTNNNKKHRKLDS